MEEEEEEHGEQVGGITKTNGEGRRTDSIVDPLSPYSTLPSFFLSVSINPFSSCFFLESRKEYYKTQEKGHYCTTHNQSPLYLFLSTLEQCK